MTAYQTPGTGSFHSSGAAGCGEIAIERLTAIGAEDVHSLAELLIDCVDGGASVSFMHPLPLPKALEFWRGIAADVAAGRRALLIARDSSQAAAGGHGAIIGTVHLILDQDENQPHRADLSKMLVCRRARRLGYGAALVRAAEKVARDAGKSLLVLDTASVEAERLYERLGWKRVGVVPGFALWPKGGRCDTTFYYREL
jgi:GNAT superfamily N-acetyltransferase